LEIIAEGRPNFFSITYELTGVKIVEDGNDYSRISYDTQLQIPLELTGDSSIYSMPTSDTVKIYVDDRLVYTSPKITQKTAKFNTGDIDVSNANYVKIVAEIDVYGCIIISDALLVNK
jgi:hypothetical protein